MSDAFLKLYVKGQMILAALKNEENGQDLIEYALVVALIALAATTTMSSLGVAINNAFSTIGTRLNSSV